MNRKTQDLLSQGSLAKILVDARGGDLRCQYWLGQAFAFGTHFPHDFSFAFEMLIMACGRAHVPSYYSLMKLWNQTARHTKAQEDKYLGAMSDLKTLASEGSGEAHLAIAYAMAKDWIELGAETFIDHILDAAKCGDPIGQFNAGCMWYFGVGVARDAQQAVGWFDDAVDSGCKDASFYMWSILRHYERGWECARRSLSEYRSLAWGVTFRRLPIWGRWLVGDNGKVVPLESIAVDGVSIGCYGLRAFVLGCGLDAVMTGDYDMPRNFLNKDLNVEIPLPPQHRLTVENSDDIADQDARYRVVESIRFANGAMEPKDAYRMIYGESRGADFRGMRANAYRAVHEFLAISRSLGDFDALMGVVCNALKFADAHECAKVALSWVYADYLFSFRKAYSDAAEIYRTLLSKLGEVGVGNRWGRKLLVDRLWNAIRRGRLEFGCSDWLAGCFGRTQTRDLEAYMGKYVSEILSWGVANNVTFGPNVIECGEPHCSQQTFVPPRAGWAVRSYERFYEVPDKLTQPDARLKETVQRVSDDLTIGLDTAGHWFSILKVALLLDRNHPELETIAIVRGPMGPRVAYDFCIPDIDTLYRFAGGPLDHANTDAMRAFAEKRNAAYKSADQRWGEPVVIEWGTPEDMSEAVFFAAVKAPGYAKVVAEHNKAMSDTDDLLAGALSL